MARWVYEPGNSGESEDGSTPSRWIDLDTGEWAYIGSKNYSDPSIDPVGSPPKEDQYTMNAEGQYIPVWNQKDSSQLSPEMHSATDYARQDLAQEAKGTNLRLAAAGALVGASIFSQIAAQATAGTSYQVAGGAGTTGTLSDVAVGSGDAEYLAAEKAAEEATAQGAGAGLEDITAGQIAATGTGVGGAAGLAGALQNNNQSDPFANAIPTDTESTWSTNPSTADLGGNINATTGMPSPGIASTIGNLLFGNGSQTGAINPALSSLAKQLGIDPALLGSNNNSGPLMNALAGALGAYGSNQASNTIADAYKYGIDQANPFASQRGQYQQQLANMPINPSNPYGNKLQKQIANPNLFQNQYGTELQKQMANPNLFNNPYGNTLQGMMKNPNLFNNQYQTAAQKMASDPNFGSNQYGTEAGRMISDPSYFLNNPMMSNLRDVTMNTTQRQLAAQLGGDQGSIGARDTLNKQLMAAQTPTAMNYFQGLSNADVGTRNSLANYFQSLAGSGNQANQNTTSYMNTLSNANLGTNQNTSNYLSTLSNANLGTNQNTTNYLNTLSGANTNANNTGLGYYNAMQTNAGANISPTGIANTALAGGTQVAGQNQQTYGNLGSILNQLGNGQNSPLASLYNNLFIQ